MVRGENSENSPFEVDSGAKADPNSPMALDLSYKPPTSLVVNVPTFVPTSFISSRDEMNKKQSLQQPSINNSPLMFNCRVETCTGVEKRELSQEKKEQTGNNDQINCGEINNVLINSEINNYQINNGQISYNQISNNLVNVDQMQHGQLKNSRTVGYNSNHINVNQVNAEVTNNSQFYSNCSNNSLPIEQSVLNNHSMPMVNSRKPPLLSMNSMPVIPFPLPLELPLSEMHKSTQMLESIRNSTRPFKAYPKDPLVLSASSKVTSSAYNKFRKEIFEQVKHTENEGTNSKMRRTSNRSGSPTSSTTDKDRAYMERRKKNNAAAKRSRDNRRAKEDEIAVRAAFLEEQNLKLWHGLYKIAKIAKEQNVQIDHKEVEGNDCLLSILLSIDAEKQQSH